MITFNPDKFGYYSAGNQTSFSKLEALEWARRNNTRLAWHFNDDIYNAIDWMIEPPGDLWEMYKQRARQIREAYDYVVLWYSGGSDGDIWYQV